MIRSLRLGGMLAIGAAGCISSPPLDNPVALQSPMTAEACENPILVSPGRPTALSYREVFERCLDVTDDYFEVLSANPYEGRIVTKPRIAPGYEQFWKPGNSDPRSRLLATLQTIRQTALVEIRTGERGGYEVYVLVEKELEDLARPSRQSVGAVFQEAPTVDRHLEVVGPSTVSPATISWFPIGRDYALEQDMLQRIRECR
jgi:hypothetical protein